MCQKVFKGNILPLHQKDGNQDDFMGIAEFTIPTELKPETARELAKSVGSCVVRALFNGQSGDIAAKLETAELTGSVVGSGTGQYAFGFELWSGKDYLGDVYLRANGITSEVRIEATQVTPDKAEILQGREI